MPIQVLRRDSYFDGPKELGDLFRLTKGKKAARCQMLTHVLGWELKLFVGSELLQSQVCRSQDEVFSTGEAWKAAMQAKEWV